MPIFRLIGPVCDRKMCYSPVGVGVAVCILGGQLNLVPFGCYLDKSNYPH